MEGVHLEIQPQPDDTTCGPTCLHAVYRYFDDAISLEQVIASCPQLDEGGTLAPLLGAHALRRGYDAKVYSFNLSVLDPTWFVPTQLDLKQKLTEQLTVKDDPKLQRASRAYLEFLACGGSIVMQDLTRQLIRHYLGRSIPILAGLSATYLYQTAREAGPPWHADDVNGHPVGHFVVLCGYNRDTKMVRIADPYLPNPFAPRDNYYTVNVDRVVCAILLGILTYDANLLILRPRKKLTSQNAPHCRDGT
ncbi:MAG: hypothetical protein KDA92_01340 [Planctomycetales bacterium]|nr:hypothetical protein [Planctomycetales bacterium]MCA9166111.1 hypothetical protein [Planctomycetales bacterium]